MSNKRTDCSNLTVAMQKKNDGKYVASVTDYDIPYMEGSAIKRKTNHKRKFWPEEELSITLFYARGCRYDLMLCNETVSMF